MAQRVFLHIGPPKTGTSFLQAAWYQYRDAMRERGLLYPGNQRPEQFQAAAVATRKQDVVSQMQPRAAAAWDRVTAQVAAWSGDALLSSEHYALGRRSSVPAIMERLREVAHEVHLVVGARDLARQIPADWQQTVKQGSITRFEDFIQAVANDEPPHFWRAQPLPRLLEAWGGSLPADRVHIVVLGRPGTPHTLLWDRMCAVFGINGDFLGPVERANESINAAQAELIRRTNIAFGAARQDLTTKRVMRRLIAEGRFADDAGAAKLLLPRSAAGWAAERSQEIVDALQVQGYDVHGDLSDLLVHDDTPLADGVAHASEAELAALAPRVIARLVGQELERRGPVRQGAVRSHDGPAADETRQRLQQYENESVRDLALRTARQAAAAARRRLRR